MIHARKRTFLWLGLLLGCLAPQADAHAENSNAFRFSSHQEDRRMVGTLEGKQAAEYHLTLTEGQELSVLCHARKQNVTFFVKDAEGHMLHPTAQQCAHQTWRTQVPHNGKYTVAVFQHHGAALKGQSAFYRLHVSAH
ncbi:hypothetical protein [Acetobacter indonesiensis]|uniref:Peptidase C-terminal archaeal/bacterial domain-containing protein n=2 Tax=Acetobacter indonesiensis TaxID=104101 RepID=A0A252AUP9_9PROT|nr:hypothetical protein [Acetobacter indonesiensis]MCG0994700.1 hypothetical protein [Acetobacter indonesiensis]OUI93958.1 hypothetical protein HK17_06690 [Acetobacter indonesiensis]